MGGTIAQDAAVRKGIVILCLQAASGFLQEDGVTYVSSVSGPAPIGAELSRMGFRLVNSARTAGSECDRRRWSQCSR